MPTGSVIARAQAVLAMLALLILCGCQLAGRVQQRIESTERIVERVLSYGAYYCAPRELALARAHLEFARVELIQGDPVRAEHHVAEADLNARAAERLSPADRCAGAGGRPLETGPDRDADGLADDADACPDDPEDRDGHLDADGCPDPEPAPDRTDRASAPDECPGAPDAAGRDLDGDGCPDPDRDADGVRDDLDRCPAQPGVRSNAGCPRLGYRGVEITPKGLRTNEPVLFETGTATIRSVSFPVLESIADVLRDHPDMQLEIQGHTDSQGDDADNLRLSRARAEAVRRFLIERGVGAARLTAQGYGETRPIESNRTSQGREINRRVEFVKTSTP